VLALTWRRDPIAKWSWLMFVLVMISLGFNLAVLDRDSACGPSSGPSMGWCKDPYSLAGSAGAP